MIRPAEKTPTVVLTIGHHIFPEAFARRFVVNANRLVLAAAGLPLLRYRARKRI